MPPANVVQVSAAGCRQAIGLLQGGALFLAATLKLLALTAFPSLNLSGLARAHQAALIGVEGALAAGLVFLRPHVLVWRGAAALFLLAGGASAAGVFTGRQSCGCFGSVSTSPGLSLAVCLCGLLLLAFAMNNPTQSQRSVMSGGMLLVSGPAAVVLCITAALAAWLVVRRRKRARPAPPDV
ncbi:MAG: hypothetical protein K6T86_14595 [Pirellulales bacterium]|nr:hypothetical protein [Pirellulales bacterium]